jgi:hypothetical protein
MIRVTFAASCSSNDFDVLTKDYAAGGGGGGFGGLGGGGFGGLGGSMETIPGYGRRAAAAGDRTILHLRGVLRYRVIFMIRPTTMPSASTSKSSSSPTRRKGGLPMRA